MCEWNRGRERYRKNLTKEENPIMIERIQMRRRRGVLLYRRQREGFSG